MSRRNWIIDPWAFARTSGSRDGYLEPGELTRLAGLAVGRAGPLSISASGEVGADGRMYVRLRIDGELMLLCQRCLEPVAHVVGRDAVFQLWPLDRELPDEELEEDAFDALPVGVELDLAELVEDEVLLGIPLAPRHETCSVPVSEHAGEGASPFDVLKQLKRPQ